MSKIVIKYVPNDFTTVYMFNEYNDDEYRTRTKPTCNRLDRCLNSLLLLDDSYILFHAVMEGNLSVFIDMRKRNIERNHRKALIEARKIEEAMQPAKVKVKKTKVL